MSVTTAQHNQVNTRQYHRKVFEIPPLEGGDRLTREEFERRYNAMPHLKKAELIEGRVYMPAAVRRSHGAAHGDIITWLGIYRVATPGLEVDDNTTIRLDEENAPQPDAVLRIISATHGSSKISGDDYVEGPPELAIEVAGSSASYDLHDKLDVYRRNGVQEYIVWQLHENHLDWFQLIAGQYVPILPDEHDIIHSHIFPGLWLAVEALLAGDMAEVLAVVQQGIQSQEHTAFVQRLNE